MGTGGLLPGVVIAQLRSGIDTPEIGGDRQGEEDRHWNGDCDEERHLGLLSFRNPCQRFYRLRCVQYPLARNLSSALEWLSTCRTSAPPSTRTASISSQHSTS